MTLHLLRSGAFRLRLLPSCIVKLALLAFVSCITAFAADTRLINFDLPQDLAEISLKRFSSQANREVLFSAGVVDGIRTNAVKGRMTSTEALQRLLARTGRVAVADERTGAFSVKEEGAGLESNPGTANNRPSESASRATGPQASAGTGAITGRVYKPATGEYVRNAEVSVVGMDLRTETDSSGFYRLDGVPGGNVVVVVKVLGYEPAQGTVSVVPGQRATRDFDLQALGSGGKEGAVRLEAFEVTAEREGNAKALQDQKRSMNISNVVGSEVFGDTSEGNVGEFLKYLPGVDLDYVQADARGPRMRGMDARYVGFTMDGIKLASADAFGLSVGTNNAGTDDSRAFSFESVSFSSVDSVEVFKTLSADLDADSPAGVINLRSKRAFDRKGRRIFWTANLTGNGEDFYWKKMYGPFDGKHRPMRGGGMLEYSDQYFGNRLGIVVNLNRSDSFGANRRVVMSGINLQTTATDLRPAVPRTIAFVYAPNLRIRTSETITIDFKASSKFNIGLVSTFSQFEGWIDGNQFTFTTSTNNTAATGRSSVLGDDPMLEFTTTTASGSQITMAGSANIKLTNTLTLSPRFDFKPTPNLSFEGRFSFSHAKNDYESLPRGVVGARMGALTRANSGLVFRGERPSSTSAQWTITQVAGKDWANLDSYVNPNFVAEADLHRNEVVSGEISGRWQVRRGPLDFLKFGVKHRSEQTKYSDATDWSVQTYVGPAGTQTPSWAAYASPTLNNMGTIGVNLFSISGKAPVRPGRQLIAQLFKDHPEYFTHTGGTAANYYTSFIGSVRDLTEGVDAAYLLANGHIGRLQVQPGLRMEETSTETVAFDQRPRSEVINAGFTVDATGRADTIDGLKYQFESLPKLKRKGSYRDWFPSVGFKYDITENLIAQAGFSKAISRPSLFRLSGPVTINEATSTINAPNPSLLPERSDNYSVRLAYYFQRVGTLSVGVFQNTIENFRGTFEYSDPESIAALGFDPDEYAGYTVSTERNIEGSRRFRGMEIEYSQALSFLPGFLRGLNVFTNYTRNYASERRGGLAPHNISAGVSYGYHRFSANVRAIWMPDTPWTQNNLTRYREGRTMTDCGASFKVSDRITLSVGGRNIFNTPYRLIDNYPEGKQIYWHEIYGSLWTFSIKGSL
ncbi:MAG: TonB-dependent receptor [Opitutaceae bacterium]|nr:TonB-dependent receptor [Opitutaceae bacterium]